MSRVFVAEISVRYRSVLLPASCPACGAYLDGPQGMSRWDIGRLGSAFTPSHRADLGAADNTVHDPEAGWIRRPPVEGPVAIAGVSYRCRACDHELVAGGIQEVRDPCCCKGPRHAGSCCRGWRHDPRRERVIRCAACNVYPTADAAAQAHEAACGCAARPARVAA